MLPSCAQGWVTPPPGTKYLFTGVETSILFDSVSRVGWIGCIHICVWLYRIYTRYITLKMSLEEARVLAFCGELKEYPELSGLLTTPYFVFDVGGDWVHQYKQLMIVDGTTHLGLVARRRQNNSVAVSKQKSSVDVLTSPLMSYYKTFAPKDAPMPDYTNCHQIRHLLILLGVVAYNKIGIPDGSVKWHNYRCCFEEGTTFTSEKTSFSKMVSSQLILEPMSTFEKVFCGMVEYTQSLLVALEFTYGKESMKIADSKFGIDDPVQRSFFLAFAICSSGEMSVVEEYINNVKNSGVDYKLHPLMIERLKQKVLPLLNKRDIID